ncbi:MAG: hypothetical protein Sapg2KO_30230 [Saprospiraceae bacterium]
MDRWPTALYDGDSLGYYLHVVSAFVNQDVGDYDQTITKLREINPASPDPREDKFGIRLTDRGRRYIKYTLGVPVMETPFFLLAHAWATISPKYEANGWTYPYRLLIGFSIVCYVTLAFYLLIGILQRYFTKPVVTLVVFALILATNLFYHTNYVIMSHGFLFFQHSLLIYWTVQFFKKSSVGLAFAIGATVGLITLTRVPEIVVGLVPLLWGVTNKASFLERISFFIKNYSFLICAILGFGLVFSLQISYWYYVSGQLVFNPYAGEGFNFLNPKFFKGFFHFRNGWLLYTPIMAFAIFGLLVLQRYAKAFFWPVLSFVFLQAYIHYSYYAWTFFPGLGQRPMVETYPLLSFALAAAFAFFIEKKKTSWLPLTALILCSILNLFQTWQMREGVIWSERHNAAFYWETFGTMKSTLNSLRAYDTKELQPDSNKLERIAVLFTEDFEDTTRIEKDKLSKTFQRSGNYAYFAPDLYHTVLENYTLKDVSPGDWLKLSIDAYMDQSNQIFNRDGAMNLIILFHDGTGKRRKERNIKPSTYPENTTYSIWTAGIPNTWGTASFYTKVPKNAQADWAIKVLFTNPYGQLLYLDDFKLEQFKKR